MDIRKKVIPNNSRGELMTDAGERDLIFFRVTYNRFRDVGVSVANEVTDREEWETCECCLALPEGYREVGEETPLVIFCHGAGGRVSEENNMIGGIKGVLPCLDAGYAVLDVNGSEADGRSMGCPEHIFALYKAYRHVIKGYNLSERVLLGGSSMGGHTAMNFANLFPSIVMAIGLFYPRLNIDAVTVDGHTCIGTWDKPNLTDRIAEIYRFPDKEWCEENVIGFNPYRNRSFVNAEGRRVVIPPCPIKIWQGMEDKTVDPVMVREYYESIRRSGSYAELHMLEGMRHGANDVMRRELVMWFDRFI